jgi:acetylglutamate kinase
MKQSLHIIKVGGNILDDESKLNLFLEAFAAIKGNKILVHGGGKLATLMAEKLNIPQKMVEGRRITDAETLKIVTMVYAGYINKTIVAKLNALDNPAIGISGADAGSIMAHKRIHEEIDFGLVGDIDFVNTNIFQTMLENQLSIVVAPITQDKKGQLLNTNADTIAQEIAKSLSNIFETTLIYSFEKKGVLLDIDDDKTLVPAITNEIFKQLKSEGKIFAGMIPKIENALEATGAGVKTVIIGDALDLVSLVGGNSGTSISS